MNNGMNEYMTQYTKAFEQLKKSLEPYETFKEALDINMQIAELFKKSVPNIDIPKLEVPIIEFPKITFPKIEFPKIKIDYEKIEKLTSRNSSFGWTLTGEMNTSLYLNEELLELSLEQIDDVFVNYYEENSNENFYGMKEIVLGEIDENWKSVVNDCFDLYEEDKYKVIIPLLITIIEGHIAEIAESDFVGWRLLKEWEGKILEEKEKLLIIITYSLYNYLSTKLFARKNFTDERGSVLNRHWVLHGRDNPICWSKVDALKLMNTISTLQFVKK